MERESGPAATPPETQHPPPPSSQPEEDAKDDQNRKKAAIRKRTKTGCLTCRKRRIKCDEGRPTCNNCIKSKRQCEGYNQRVIFKDPISGLQGGHYGPALYPPGSSHLVTQMTGKSSSQVPLPVIAPKPPSYAYQEQQHMSYGHFDQVQRGPTPYEFGHGVAAGPSYQQPIDPTPQQSHAGYVKIEHHPGAAHQFRPPFAQQGHASTSTSRHPTVTDDLDEEQGENVGAAKDEFLNYDPPDDDEYMGESDDETRDPREILGPVVKQFTGTWDMNGTKVRAFSTFAKCNVLSEYTASAQIQELKDPRVLAIFMHFIQVTGPSMSLYERHPFDYGSEGDFDATPKGANNLWSYTFPIIAFNHPALLHSILALASLQIAKLQKIPATAAMKHYHLAIRRIARNVRRPLRRTQPPTLAATLLLAYFEVWSSDHTKWCNHLFGARILLREIPLRAMSRRCLPIKRIAQRKKDAEDQSGMNSFFPGFRVASQSELLELDYDTLQKLSGQHITPEDYCLGEDQLLDPESSLVTDRDIEQYENVRDLYWWYCKMDVYQSMLGGTKLFMDYEHWTQCPPRAPISKLEAIYGSYDHLILLLGRLTDFASKDVARKRKASQSKGPPPGPPGAPSPPTFPGIVPTTGNFRVPMGFTPPRESSPQSDTTDEWDPAASFQAALQEWEEIKEAFATFENSLGSEFQPLRPEYSDRRESPFGMTLQYRTFSVAGIWMSFYMGMIHLYRTHPSMAPAAMQAAGMAAQQTGQYSNKLGRVAAGLSDDCSQMTEISTLVSAAFIESCFCLFVAAIEYRDNAQRVWCIRRLRDISRLTGWQSARQIADGCESAWIKAYQLGRGPEYHRTEEIGVPISVWENPRRIDRVIKEMEPAEDNRLVLAKSERASFALGLIGVEHDLQVLELKDEG